MSAFIPKDELKHRLTQKGCEIYGIVLDETTVINLPVASAMLGLSEESTKKWYAKYNVRHLPGAAKLTSGRRFFLAMEQYFDEQDRKHEAGEGLC